MTRARRDRSWLVSAVMAAAAIVTILAACKSEAPASCTADVDCPRGSFCREGTCAVVTEDGGVDGAVVSCVSAGSACSTDSDCCSPPCQGSRCGGSTSGTSGRGSSGTSGTSGSSGTSGTSGTSSGTSGGTCGDVYTICSADFECCPGLTCTSGSCR